MTDNEIIKALEFCSTYKGKCTDCPAFVKVDRSNCKKVLLGAVEIINRLQAKIEKLEKVEHFADKTIHDATETAYKNGQNQGIEDFAERLKQGLPTWLHPYVDMVKKEMKGEE